MLINLLVCLQDAELANARLLVERQTAELTHQREEIHQLRSQLDNNNLSTSHSDLVSQRDALLHRIAVSHVFLALLSVILLLTTHGTEWPILCH